MRAAYDGSDNLLDPTWGFRASLRVSPEHSWQSSGNASYARIQFDGSYYQPFGSKLVMAAPCPARLDPGRSDREHRAVTGFYAGGGGSVRGFGYQEIGPRDSVGDPSGGRALTELSLEARIKTGLLRRGNVGRAIHRWRCGRCGNDARAATTSASAPVSASAMHTTFGPIRIDVATPLDRRKGESVIGIYVALGQAF